jgi:hypothetical protein
MLGLGRHAHGRGIHQDVEFLIVDEGRLPGIAVFFRQRPAGFFVAREDCDAAVAGVVERGDDGLGHAAAARHADAGVERNRLVGEHPLNGDVIGIQAREHAGVIHDGVHGIDARGGWLDAVEAWHDVFLEWHGDRATPDAERADACDRAAEVAGGEGFVKEIEVQPGVEKVVQPRAEVPGPRGEGHAHARVFIEREAEIRHGINELNENRLSTFIRTDLKETDMSKLGWSATCIRELFESHRLKSPRHVWPNRCCSHAGNSTTEGLSTRWFSRASPVPNLLRLSRRGRCWGYIPD